jgi:hypothetical protein
MPSDDGTDEGPRRHGFSSKSILDDVMKGRWGGAGGDGEEGEMGSPFAGDLSQGIGGFLTGVVRGDGAGDTGWGEGGGSESGPGRPNVRQSDLGARVRGSGEDFIHPQALVGLAQDWMGAARSGALAQLLDRT